MKTVLAASLLPDIPLFLLTVWYFAVYGFNFGPRYDEFYYESPLWIVSHNLFHGPLVIMGLAALGLVLYKTASRGRAGHRLGVFLLSLAFGTGLHSFLDILTHHNDGPLLLFPLEWSLRFSSPISYWDPEHYAGFILPIETLATLLFGIYWLRRLRNRRRRVGHPGKGLQH
jgi:hypothetical protein